MNLALQSFLSRLFDLQKKLEMFLNFGVTSFSSISIGTNILFIHFLSVWWSCVLKKTL